MAGRRAVRRALVVLSAVGIAAAQGVLVARRGWPGQVELFQVAAGTALLYLFGRLLGLGRAAWAALLPALLGASFLGPSASDLLAPALLGLAIAAAGWAAMNACGRRRRALWLGAAFLAELALLGLRAQATRAAIERLDAEVHARRLADERQQRMLGIVVERLTAADPTFTGVFVEQDLLGMPVDVAAAQSGTPIETLRKLAQQVGASLRIVEGPAGTTWAFLLGARSSRGFVFVRNGTTTMFGEKTRTGDFPAAPGPRAWCSDPYIQRENSSLRQA